MWIVQYKASSDSEPWITLDEYDNKTSACFNAFWVSKEYFAIVVRQDDGSVVWSN